jgi:hypothetical protein
MDGDLNIALQDAQATGPASSVHIQKKNAFCRAPVAKPTDPPRMP